MIEFLRFAGLILVFSAGLGVLIALTVFMCFVITDKLEDFMHWLYWRKYHRKKRR